MRTLRAALSLALISSLSLPAGAADLVSAEGADVRLTTNADVELVDAETGVGLGPLRRGAELHGRLAFAERETLVLRLRDGRRVRLQRDTLAHVQERVPSTVGRRAGRGALIGGGLGLAFVAAAAASSECSSGDYCGAGIVVAVASIFTGLGAAAGALIGAVSGRPERWRDVSDTRAPAGSNTSGQPRRSGAKGVGLTLRF